MEAGLIPKGQRLRIDDRVLGVAPQAWPVASPLDAQATAALHEAPVVADADGRDVRGPFNGRRNGGEAIRMSAVGGSARRGDMRRRKQAWDGISSTTVSRDK